MIGTPRLVFSLLSSIALVFAPGVATAQEFPTKPIRIIVPNGPGNPLDLSSRLLAPEMSKLLGQPIVVENKPGAGNVIGYEYVAKQAPADGYTIMVSGDATAAIMPVTVKDLRFDPVNDLPPFITLGSSKLMLASSSQHPWKTFNEMVAYTKANPGKLNYGAVSTNNLLYFEVILRDRGLNVVGVPYKATADGMEALVRGDVHMGWLTETAAIGWGDKTRILAQTGDKRSAAFPNVPTFAELGLPQIVGFTVTLNARAGTPKVVIDKLYATASRALNQPEGKAQMAKLSMEVLEPAQQTPEAAQKSLADLAKFFADAAKKAGIQPQ